MQQQLIFLYVALITANAMCLAQTSLAAPVANESTIIDLEKSVWQAYKNKQTRSFKKLLCKSYYGVYADGIKTLDMEVADMEKTDLHNYPQADIRVEFANANIAIITYKSTKRASSDGQDVPGTYYNESVWIKKGEQWLNTFHTEIKAK